MKLISIATKDAGIFFQREEESVVAAAIEHCSEVKEQKSAGLHKRKVGLGAKGKMKGEITASSVPGGLSSQKM